LGCGSGPETRSPAGQDAAPRACELVLRTVAQQSGAETDKCTAEAFDRGAPFE